MTLHISTIRAHLYKKYVWTARTFLQKTMIDILEFFIAVFFQLLYLPLYILGTIYMKYDCLKMRLKIRMGRGRSSKLGPIIRRVNMIDVTEPSTKSLLDFYEHRGSAYLYSRWAKMPRHIAKLFTGNETTELISDEQLAYVLTSTVCAHSVSWDEERGMYHFDMDGFERLTLFEGFYFDARGVYFSKDLKKIIICMVDGKEYHNDVTGEQRKTYNLVKLHLQVCITFYVVGLAHNHVHFVFPSAIAVLAEKLLDHNKVLYKLLSPHFQFTEKILFIHIWLGLASTQGVQISEKSTAACIADSTSFHA